MANQRVPNGRPETALEAAVRRFLESAGPFSDEAMDSMAIAIALDMSQHVEDVPAELRDPETYRAEAFLALGAMRREVRKGGVLSETILRFLREDRPS